MQRDLLGLRLAVWCALSAHFFLSCGQPQQSLRQRVTDFWAAQVDRDRVRAQEFVAPESRNAFLRHRERIYRDPRIQEIHEENGDEARVRMAYEGYVEELHHFQPLAETQLWKKIDGAWFLKIDPPEKELEEAFNGVYGTPEASRRGTDADGQVRVNPEIRIPFFNRAQLGTLTIRNGTEQPLRISRVELDETLFEVLEKPEEIPPLQKRHLKIRHLGGDELKNQTSPMTLVTEQAGEAQEHSIEILYNYLSPSLLALLGLKDEDIPGLKRTDRLSPKMGVEVPPQQAAESDEARKQVEALQE